MFGNFITSLNKHYPRFVQAMYRGSNMVVAATMGIVTILSVVALIMFGYVEFHRIHEAILIAITDDKLVSWFASFCVIFGLVAIEFIIKREEYNQGVFSFYHEQNQINRGGSLVEFFNWTRYRLGFWREYVILGKVFDELPEEYLYKPAPSPTKYLKRMKILLIFIVIALSFYASAFPLMNEYSDLPAIQGFSSMLTSVNMAEGYAIFINVGYTTSVALIEITLAGFVASLSVRSLQEIEELRTQIIKEEKVDEGIYFVGEVTDNVSRSFSQIKDMKGILAEDKIDIVNQDFYDSMNEEWLNGGDGWKTKNYFMKRVKRALDKRV